MAKVVKQVSVPGWLSCPYRNQGTGDTCSGYALGSIVFPYHGERGAMEYIQYHSGRWCNQVPSQSIEFSGPHMIKTGVLLESEWPELQYKSTIEMEAVASKHKMLEFIDLGREPLAAVLRQYIDDGWMLYISTGANLAGRIHTDGSQDARWDFLHEPGGTHAIAAGAYQIRDDGSTWLVYQNSHNKDGQPWINDQYMCNLPTEQGGLFHVWAFRGPLKAAENGGDTEVECKTIRRGDKGQDVEYLQESLNTLGFNVGNVDADFGSKTEKALIAFQRAKGLSADGVCGSKSWTALAAALGDPADPPTNNDDWAYPPSPPTAYFTPTDKSKKVSKRYTIGDLWLDSGHTKIKADGQLLRALDAIQDHFNADRLEFISKNSLFRTTASNAACGGASDSKHKGGYAADFYVIKDGKRLDSVEVAAWTEANLPYVKGIGVYRSGYMHIDTANRSKRTYWWLQTSGSNTPGWGGIPVVFKSGHRSPAVIKIQQKLNALGYSCGAADGSFGANTKAALVKWQKANGLTADGAFGSASNAKMGVFSWA